MTDVNRRHWSYHVLKTWAGLPAQLDQLHRGWFVLDVFDSLILASTSMTVIDRRSRTLKAILATAVTPADIRSVRLIGQKTELIVDTRTLAFDGRIVVLMGRFLDAVDAAAGRRVLTWGQITEGDA